MHGDTHHQWNWAGNYRYSAARIHFPKSVDEVRDLVRRCAKVKALGTRHSFNGIADSREDLISLAKLQRLVEIDSARQTVTVDGGIRYGELCRELHRNGFALPTLASLPHISVAGACATATHGSGDSNANLASTVSRMQFIDAEGEIVELSRDQNPGTFEGAVVHVGGLGVVIRLTLDLIPTYEVRQDVYENLPMKEVRSSFETIVSGGYSVSLFTDWQSDSFDQVWLKRLVTGADSADMENPWYGATPATGPLHPIASMPAENCTAQMGECGPWHERIPHFRFEFTPSCGEELQSEYLVPRQYAVEAFSAIHRIREVIGPLLQVSEVRTIAADNLWMSPCYREACVSIHFTWLKDWPQVEKVLPKVEDALAPFEARPHWGKLFTMKPDRVQSLYPRLDEFRALLRSYDPGGKFRNPFLNDYIFAE